MHSVHSVVTYCSHFYFVHSFLGQESRRDGWVTAYSLAQMAALWVGGSTFQLVYFLTLWKYRCHLTSPHDASSSSMAIPGHLAIWHDSWPSSLNLKVKLVEADLALKVSEHYFCQSIWQRREGDCTFQGGVTSNKRASFIFHSRLGVCSLFQMLWDKDPLWCFTECEPMTRCK